MSFSRRAVERIQAGAQPARSFYLDAGLLMDYWSGPRGYHHTASSNLYWALHEALRLALEEGLEARWERPVTCRSARRSIRLIGSGCATSPVARDICPSP